jgi:hypothetical protein
MDRTVGDIMPLAERRRIEQSFDEEGKRSNYCYAPEMFTGRVLIWSRKTGEIIKIFSARDKQTAIDKAAAFIYKRK